MRSWRWAVGAAGLLVAAAYLPWVVDADAVVQVWGAVRADALGLAAVCACYAAAFGLRAWAWCATLPGLRPGQSWAALHVSLLGNHVLPLRLGEALRVTSVLRRTKLAMAPVVASALALRAADLVALIVLPLVAAPAFAREQLGPWLWAALAVVAAVGYLALRWLRGREMAVPPRRWAGVAAAALTAWVLEAAVVWEICRASGHAILPAAAIAVTAVTIAAQTVALTPGGFGSYEAAATAVLVAVGVPPGPAFAIALATHAVKTAYALLVGAVALLVPAPSYWGWLRLPKLLPPRPAPQTAPPDAPVVAFLPVHDEEQTVGEVVTRLPDRIGGHPVVAIVVDDGSSDASAQRARVAGARVVSHDRNLGLGAAVRRGLAEAVSLLPAAVVYLDADDEYSPEDAAAVVAPVLAGTADYVVGSRFRGEIRSMLARRRLGNQVLTAWLRWLTRRTDITDGQSGLRAFSAAAAADAEVVHDYNYAQVLTLDLLGKGYTYAEVPIGYGFRATGTSFVRLGTYLRRVVPAVYRELNADPAGRVPQSSTTCSANLRRAAAHAAGSTEPSRSASTAS